ncbi:MAG TPA: hypothetical protein VHO94_01430 [Oscillospiraceae bacterium]|nr:hypothetical protein [Oscillospiraceae bacterium]
MPKASSEYWNDLVDDMRSKERDHDEGCSCKRDDREDDRKPEHECHDCDSDSARALRKIVSSLDELNNQDLRLFDQIVERALCISKH